MEIKVLDGKNTIGGSKILVANKDTAVFLDFGKNFKTWGDYFEEFLQPRVSTGIIHDLWRLGLLPHYSGIYREDLILSNFKKEVEKNPLLNISAILLSHAHIDHCGYIPFLRENIPVYASLITKRLMNVMQNTGKGGVFSQYANIKLRKEIEDLYHNKVLKNRTTKDGNVNYLRKFNVEAEGQIGAIKYKFYLVEHSIPGASAIYLEVDGVKIAYTGDLRFHGASKQSTYDFIESMSKIKPDILISEGTRVTKEDYTMWKDSKGDDSVLGKNKPISEEDVYNISLETVKKHPDKLIIADFSARNIERLGVFLKIAKETNRRLATMPEDAYMLYAVSKYYEDDIGSMANNVETINLIDDDNLFYFTPKRLTTPPWLKEDSPFNKKCKSKSVNAKDIQNNPGNYILCFSFWNMVHLLDIDLEGGIYIYSSSEAYTEEQAIDMNRLLNWIDYFHLIPYGIKRGSSNPEFDKRYHSSGHASMSNIVNMIEKINPKVLIPVHTEYYEVFANVFDSNMRVIKDNQLNFG